MAKQPKIEFNVYFRDGAIDRYLGTSWAPSEAAAIRNVWFRKYGREAIKGNVFAREKRKEIFQPQELFRSGEQLRLV